MPEQALSSSYILLFAGYTLITIIGGLATVIFGRGRVTTMGEKAKNDAVTTITSSFSGALGDARLAREELAVEREKRAELQGEFKGLVRQMDKLTASMDIVLQRIKQVEGEKKALEEEKVQLEKTIDLKSVEHQKLMATIQSRIDEAVQGVRKDYETRINELTEEIRQKNEEITQLKSQLEEKSHEQSQQTTSPIGTNHHVSDAQPTDALGTRIDTRSDSGGIDPTNPVAGDGAATII